MAAMFRDPVGVLEDDSDCLSWLGKLEGVSVCVIVSESCSPAVDEALDVFSLFLSLFVFYLFP